MSLESDGSLLGAQDGAADLFARAAAADARTHVRLEAAIDDFLTPEDGRLDDRTRATVEIVLARLIATVEADIRQHAGRLLVSRGEPELALALTQRSLPILGRLIEAGLVRDPVFFRELIARVQLDLLAAALPVTAPEGEEPSLLARLANHPDRMVASAAVAVMFAEGRRKPGDTTPARTELPAELHLKLVWWVAAALREIHVGAPLELLDRVLAEAAQRSLAAQDDGERLEAAAMRLAMALDAQPAELPDVLTAALGDRRAVVFVALLAQALSIEFTLTREVVLDPAGDRLWLLLRALDLPRETIARIGLGLSDADPRRDLEGFADSLDRIVAIDPERARAGIAPLRLDPGFRAAVLSLARRPVR